METTRIIELEHPTDAQIKEMTQLAVEAFETNIMNRAMTDGVRELQEDLFRLTFRAAALEGKLYVCQEVSSGRIISLAAGFAPGRNFLDSEAQRSLGFEAFVNGLPENAKNWWTENLLKPKLKPVDEKVQQALKLITVATLGEEQRKGYGSSLIKEITRMAGSPISLNANTDANVSFYTRLGFKIIGISAKSSSFGSWVTTSMIWEDSE